MHHEEIEINFDGSCQQILGLESEILWESSQYAYFRPLTSNFLAPLIFCVSSVARFKRPVSESAKWRAAFNWSSVKTHNKSSIIKTRRQPSTAQSGKKKLVCNNFFFCCHNGLHHDNIILAISKGVVRMCWFFSWGQNVSNLLICLVNRQNKPLPTTLHIQTQLT
jgi:hypothetical protein